MNPHGRVDGPRTPPLPVSSLREEPTVFDGLGADPDPELTPEAANYIAGELEDLRAGGMAAAKACDGKQPAELHQRLMALVAEVEELSVWLAEWSSGGGGAAA